ncbi:hypothetical protein EXIGLDRAFT_211378 [Exidia glandulosa HHB12029]|uniref:RING-type domain-containing protein n=1 Tax=Exidia glandulosa HHB12029 TaxID=1314781 RepID=A0A165ZZ60_EXIGL|nr:hypothetical protein EXIGLDRAFT_211378 [Exidia glandulosa HHB12029]
MFGRRPRNPSPARAPAPLVPKALLRAHRPGVDELNGVVTLLHDALPHVDIGTLHDAIRRNLDVANVADLAANVILDGARKRDRPGDAATAIALDARHMFRTDEYQTAVKSLLLAEFAGLSKSTIQAVLAENNYSYTHSRDTLMTISARSWRFAISSWWNGKKPVAELPYLKSATGSVELNQEIYDLHAPAREAQVISDRVMAASLNEAEHVAAEALIECGCCFADVVWEETASCAAGHLFCRACLVRTAQDSTSGGVRCISASASDECRAPVPRAVLEAALSPVVLRRLDDRGARSDIAQSGLQLLCCPFCPYAVHDIPPYRTRPQFIVALLIWAFGLTRSLSPWATLLFSILVGIGCTARSPISFPHGTRLVLKLLGADHGARVLAAQRRGTRFVCRNPDCGLGSCLLCGKEWSSSASHNCMEDERQKLRLHVELCMAEAVKRTCPKCHCAFVKDGGCNKMACPCGYTMCYLCRANLAEEGYRHFCQHFRPHAGPCRQCQRCDLYGETDDDAAARAAGERAKKAYIAAHGHPSPTSAGTRPLTPMSPASSVTVMLWDLVLDLELD